MTTKENRAENQGMLGFAAKVFCITVLVSGVVCGCYLFACWKSVQPIGSDHLLKQVALPLLAYGDLAALMVVVGLLVYAVLVIFRRRPLDKARLITLVLFVGTYAPFSFVASHIGTRLRIGGLNTIIASAEPLVTAIGQYEEKYGGPPNKLEDLVPEFVSQIPGTGINAYPKFGFFKGSSRLLENHNAWVILVDVSTTSAAYQSFCFYSNGNFPPSNRGRYVTRIGDWALVMSGSDPWK